jgi:hypothetical protein
MIKRKFIVIIQVNKAKRYALNNFRKYMSIFSFCFFISKFRHSDYNSTVNDENNNKHLSNILN